MNKSITRNIGDNYIEDNYTQVLRRFCMLSFMYNLNKFGGKRPRGEEGQRNTNQQQRQERSGNNRNL